ncbi:MAG TPA: class I SAM-dependent methyltransferase [Pirellulales bacterium]|nr:class I SAM-dependent methyltransferase [Pirellulales bacterium]
MNGQKDVPDPAVVLDLLEAFRRSKVMFAAVSLGLFDAIEAGAHTVDDLAQKLRADASALARLLDACVGLALLNRTDSQYENTPAASAYLTSHSPRRMTGYIGYSNAVMWKLWAHLEDAVREGGHRWKQAYGWEGPIFSHFFRTEEAKREFLMGMHGFGVISSPQVVAAFDLGRYRHLCDLGGATGHLAIAACERYPNLRATVFDLPEAASLAREIVSESSVPDRIAMASGDFFADALPEADLFALGRILHDWSEDKILKLLMRIFDRLPSGGALLIAEKLLAEDKRGPRWAQMQDLNMLTCTEGRERTLAEYTALLRQVGFSEVAGRVTPSPLDAVLAKKP